MGSTNIGSKNEVHRQIRAREYLTNTLPTSREASPGRSVRQRRGPGTNNSKGNLALSGQTTTTRGHVIYPPGKARVIAIEYNDDETDCSPGPLSTKTKNRQNQSGEFLDRLNEDTANNNAVMNVANNPGNTKPYNSGVSALPRSYTHIDKMMSVNLDQSTSREVQIDCNHRSAIAIGAKVDVSEKVVFSSRTESEGQRKRECEKPSSNSSNSLRSRARRGGQTRNERRRGRQRAQDNDLPEPSSNQTNFAKQSNSAHLSSDRNTALGKKTTTTPYSFLPTYIQPVEKDYSSQHQSKRIISSGVRSTYSAVSVGRKISTEMNRYESSTSSSSSSLESECNSPNRQMNSMVTRNAQRHKLSSTATPDTSDAEKTRTQPGVRRRRGRTINNGYSKTLNESTDTSRRPTGAAHETSQTHRAGLRRVRSRRQPAPTPPIDDKYVSLPDNYKPAAFTQNNNITTDGGMAQLNELSNSHGDVAGKRTNDRKSPSIQRFAKQPISSEENGKNIAKKNNESKSSGTSRLNIDHGQKLSDNYSGKSGRYLDRGVNSSFDEASFRSEPRLSEQFDIGASTPELNKTSVFNNKQSQARTTELIKRYSNTGESESIESIKNAHVNKVLPISEFRTTSSSSEQYSLGNKSLSSHTRSSTEGNVIVQSQQKIKARKVAEDYWPHDKVTEQLLTRHVVKEYETTALTMQETIEQLEKFADDDTPVIKSKSRSSSYTALSDLSKNYDSSQSETTVQTENNKFSSHGKYPSQRSSSMLSSSKTLTGKKDMSPCMSSTETLKEGSSGEIPPSGNSRSPSVDSTSNSDLLHANTNIVYGVSNDELFIVESDDAGNAGHTSDKNVEGDTSQSNKNKSIKDLTNSLLNWQKAKTRTDPILRATVLPHSPCLETLNEHPEPSSPKLKQKDRGNSNNEILISKSTPIQKDGSIERDEGIFIEMEVNTDPRSFDDLDKKLKESNLRTRRSTQAKDSDASNSNDSGRSLSDPSANRKRSQADDLPKDSNLLGSVQTGRPEDIGTLDQSCSSLSQISNPSSYYSDTFTPEECINETDEKPEVKSVKKKSKSDPNPEGFVRINSNQDEDGYRISASSEPNVMEPDGIGDLETFETYCKNKEKSVEEQIAATVLAVTKGPYMSKKRSVRSKKRGNLNSKGGKSIYDQLLSANQQQYHNNSTNQNYSSVGSFPNSTSTSTSSSSVTSAEPSPVGQRNETLRGTVDEFEQIFDSMVKEPGSIETTQQPHHRSVSAPVPMKLQGIESNGSLNHFSPPGRGRRTGITQAPSMSNVGVEYGTNDVISPTTEMSESPTFLPNSQSEKGKAVHDMRLHAFKNLLETEGSYVSSLRILYQDYMMPLKQPANHSTCEPRLVEQMFHKIPQLYQHHEKFYENVQKCFDDWNYKDIRLGELFLTSFNKDALLDTYTSYIKNYLNAREAVRTAKGKEAFRRFLELCRSENKEKQGLADLMIKPVQRIPRYELLIRDMLKHTPVEHPDREGLLIAQDEIHKLVVQMNRSEKDAEAAEKQDRLLSEIEQLIEDCVDLCEPKRRFLRQDIVTEIKALNKAKEPKDRSLWLFTDLIVCSTRKRFRRGSVMNLSPGPLDYSHKYKFLWKFPLEDVEHLKGNTLPGRHAVDKQLQSLHSDMEVLTNMHKQAAQIECNHVLLDDALKEIIQHVNRQIAEKKHLSFQPICPPGRVELGISTGEGVKTFSFEFLNDDNKVQFEKLFADAKRNLTTQKNRWEPTFMKAIPISRTRAGMQFSCAASNVDASPEAREVWVCNTDGYVGQVCFLTLEPEPNQTQCITVCSAKICCIAQVPTRERRLVPATVLLQEVAKGPLVPPSGNPAHNIMAWDDDVDDSDEENTSPHSTISSQSSFTQSPFSTYNSLANGFRLHKRHMKKCSLDSMLDMRARGDDISLPVMSPLIDSPLLRRRFGFSRLDRQLTASQPAMFYLEDSTGILVLNDAAFGADIMGLAPSRCKIAIHENAANDSVGPAFKVDNGSTLHGSLEEFLGNDDGMSGDARGLLAGKDSMWLGTEDGKIHIYSSSESVRGSKHCVLAHAAAVHCILYHDGQIFVALSNCDLVIYTRDPSGEWDFDNVKTKSKATPYAITKMVVVNQKELWCGCQNSIKIFNIYDHTEIDNFNVINDNKRQIHCMVASGYGVWIALDKKSQVKLYHSVTHDLLADIGVSNPVIKMLASADAIIRQHKAACLRITALLVCNDLLWVGTSAGVVLTMTLPKITHHTSILAMPVIPQGLPYGHTGHVRFLASAEIPDKEQNSLSRGGSRRASQSASKRRPSSSSNVPNTPRSVSIIISGGDGYEDFRMNSTSESAGRDDSTNHLLVWRT